MSEAPSDPRLSRELVGLLLNYRDAGRSLRCIRSLLGNGLEHVLVWDNSEDGGQSVQALLARLAGERRVSVASEGSNLGFAAGVNRGLGWIREHFPDAWVLLINNDAELLPGAAQKLISALEAAPDAVIAYPRVDHGGRVIGTAFYQRGLGLIVLDGSPDWVGLTAYASGCCQLIDPHRLKGAWFDEDFFMYGEDVEFGARLGAAGMAFVRETLVIHEGSASSGLGSHFYETRMVVSHLLLVPKLAHSGYERFLCYAGRLLMLPLRAIVRAIRYRSMVPLKALGEGLRLAAQAKGGVD
ncbi:glycosyltransferase [Thauera mechernichensis]